MRWRESLAATGAFWLLEALVFLVAERGVTVALASILILPLAGGFMSGVFRRQVRGLPLLFCGSVTLVAFVLILWIALVPADDPRGEWSDETRLQIALVVLGGCALLTCTASALGALLVARFEQLRGQ